MTHESCVQGLLARLHALYAIHRAAHWVASGNDYYADHLLFQRLYEPLDKEIDQLAEKMVHMCGPIVVAANIVTAQTSEHVQRWCSQTCPLARAYSAEQELVEYISSCSVMLDSMALLSLGWDDLLCSMSSTHEGHLYLLGRRLALEV